MKTFSIRTIVGSAPIKRNLNGSKAVDHRWLIYRNPLIISKTILWDREYQVLAKEDLLTVNQTTWLKAYTERKLR